MFEVTILLKKYIECLHSCNFFAVFLLLGEEKAGCIKIINDT
jgi:hypothetical protein